jgi:uncharacterized membrane protein
VLQLVVLGFAAPEGARAALSAGVRLHAERHLALHDAIFLTCDADGNTSVAETAEEPMTPAALGSGFWGVLLGMLLPETTDDRSAATDAVAAELVDLGIRAATIAQVRRVVVPSTTSLMLLVSQVRTNVALEELHRFAGASLVWATLDPAAVAAVQRALMTS